MNIVITRYIDGTESDTIEIDNFDSVKDKEFIAGSFGQGLVDKKYDYIIDNINKGEVEFEFNLFDYTIKVTVSKV